MFRMTVEDVFAIHNRGTVATGRVESGALRVGAADLAETEVVQGKPTQRPAKVQFRRQIG